MFNNLTMSNDIQDEKDVLGGGGVLESGVYDFTVRMAYGSVSSGGSMALNLTLETDDKRTLRATLYTTNKKGENFYTDKNQQKNYLPGFLLATNLCLLTVKKELHQVAFEDKVIPIYDYDQKKELPTKAKVAVELIGQRISAGVFKEVVDKTTKDASGTYVPTGETREQNEIDKFFRTGDGFTVAEIRGKAATAEFKDAWSAKNTGVTKNKAKGAAAGGTGAVGNSKPAGQSTTAAPAKSLFGDDN
jgi:hypothetical protein